MKKQISLFTTALFTSYAASMEITNDFDQIAQTIQLGEIAAEHMLTSENEMLELAQTLETMGGEQGSNFALNLAQTQQLPNCFRELLEDYRQDLQRCANLGFFEQFKCRREAIVELIDNLQSCNNPNPRPPRPQPESSSSESDEAPKPQPPKPEPESSSSEPEPEASSSEPDPTPQPQPPSPNGVYKTSCGDVAVGKMDKFNQIHVDYHNKQRKLHGSNQLAYSHDLYKAALKYANKLVNDCGTNIYCMDHDPTLRDLKQGENLYATTAGVSDTSIAGSKGWYDEEVDYNYNDPTKSTGIYGHFTQMIWNDSCYVGCAKAGNFMVCRYQDPGNLAIRTREDPSGYQNYVKNVKPPQK